MRTEEAETKRREAEGSLAAVRSNDVRKLKEENEELCERLAFLETEEEECRNVLNTEREMHRKEIKLNRLRSLSVGEEGVSSSSSIEEIGTTNKDREGHIRIETATEHLAEAKTGNKIQENDSCSDPTTDNVEIAAAVATNTSIQHLNKINELNKLVQEGNQEATGVAADTSNQHSDKINELESTNKLLLEENAALREQSKWVPKERKNRWFGIFMDCIRPQ